MSTPRRRRSFILLATVGLAFALAVYVATYFAFVTPALRTPLPDRFGSRGIVFRDTVVIPVYGEMERCLSRAACDHLFAPIHWADRRLRPRTWSLGQHLMEIRPIR